jgi:hypothetical protein
MPTNYLSGASVSRVRSRFWLVLLRPRKLINVQVSSLTCGYFFCLFISWIKQDSPVLVYGELNCDAIVRAVL